LPYREHRGWRWLVVSFISAEWQSRYDSFEGDVYEFGVASGVSVATFRKAIAEYGLPQPRIWGFDSFHGLPPELPGISRPLGWTSGTYDSSRQGTSGYSCLRTGSGGVKCTGSARPLTFEEQVRKIDDTHNFTRKDTNFIQGFYNMSLTTELPVHLAMRPALYVDIDCDLYVSTYQALDWLFSNKLIVPGTLIGYDDWCLTNLGTAGESRAHNEIAQKYKVKFRCVVGGCSNEMLLPGPKHNFHNMISTKLLNPVFVVETIGKSADDGMHTYPTKCEKQSKAWQQV